MFDFCGPLVVRKASLGSFKLFLGVPFWDTMDRAGIRWFVYFVSNIHRLLLAGEQEWRYLFDGHLPVGWSG